MVQLGEIGEVKSFNGRIGHNGERIKNTWYWNRDVSGGGTLIDNGHHLIDLARCFVGDFVKVKGVTMNLKWGCNVEDTANAIMVTKEGNTAIIQSSWCQDEGYLYITITGTKGVIVVENDSLKFNDKIFKYEDNSSLVLELDEFFRCIKEGIQPSPSGEDGLEILKIIQQIYEY